MLNALKILFAIYALRAGFVGIKTIILFPTPRFLLWAGFSLCLLPVAWGLIREKKWAWNAAVGLTIFQLFWKVGQTAGMFLARSVDTSTLIAVALRQLAVAIGISVAIFVLLILTRRFYQSPFAAAENENEVSPKTNSYVRPVALGVVFLLTGLLVFLHPATNSYSSAPLRILGLILVAVLWVGATLCFFERKANVIRAAAVFVAVVAGIGLLSSLTLYSYFALMGLLVSGLQLALGIAAIPAAAKARISFVD